MKTEKLYVVFKPTFESEMMDIFSGEETTLESLYNQFNGGLKPEMIHGFYTKKSSAVKEAKKLYEKLCSGRDENEPFTLPERERFMKFVTEMEALSTKYGVIVHSTGGVRILEPYEKKQVRYSKDPTSGDLWEL